MIDHPLSAFEALLGPIVNRDDQDFPPMSQPALLTDKGTVFAPHLFYPGITVELPVSRGTGLAWAPIPEISNVLLLLAGGNPAEPTDESIAVTLSHAGVKALIRDLQLIERQMEGM
ncbi:hypothetical protein RLDS_10705 [Sphingobium lactosutens DS20]|uniref:Uncharacterized protein n=2 Tax=Sphingobium TaxID=165695 RepID=T0HRP7_9SPHN|nr:hypothetical protein RLDS_10705 [Sphingobium lactosutens DS20]